ncbi:MAG: YvcK family protein [Eggerthellaceae bacterium]|nr:YvcK family protein [Eggerthellaceae bacterium]
MTRTHKADSSISTHRELKDARPCILPEQEIRAVVIGGGTGAPVSIMTLLSLGVKTSAVVAMADDGGSTGILREEAQVTPPGDIRKCLNAFASDHEKPMTQAFRYRFEFARDHTLGNLMLAALEMATGSFIEAIDICEQLLGARGHVYPSTLDLVTLVAKTKDGKILRGQARASTSQTALEKVWLETAQDCMPYDQAINVIREADLIVLGPGSLFTSIIPNLLVPGIIDAIKESKGKTLFICSLADMQGETWGLSAREHVEVLLDNGMRDLLDYVLIHSPFELKPGDPLEESYHGALGEEGSCQAILDIPDERVRTGIRPIPINYADMKAIQEQGPAVIVRNLVDEKRPTWHDPHALREAFRGIAKLCRLPLT